MICPKCFAEIPDDSSYCDACGIKILVCPACGELGTGKRCPLDNSKMIAKGEKSFEKKFLRTERNAKGNGEISLKLINKNLDIEIEIKSGDVVGRKTDVSSKQLSSYKQLSSRHAAFDFKPGTGWFVTDLNATNGTKINGDAIRPMMPVKLKLGDTLVLANIEFFVSK